MSLYDICTPVRVLVTKYRTYFLAGVNPFKVSEVTLFWVVATIFCRKIAFTLLGTPIDCSNIAA